MYSNFQFSYTTYYVVPYGNHGCACGDINMAYLYIIDNDGVDTWASYPYEAKVN